MDRSSTFEYADGKYLNVNKFEIVLPAKLIGYENWDEEEEYLTEVHKLVKLTYIIEDREGHPINSPFLDTIELI